MPPSSFDEAGVLINNNKYMNIYDEPQSTTDTNKNVFYETEKEFDEKLSGIIDMLDTCYGQYTDTDYKDVRVYDRIDLLRLSDVSDEVKNDIKIIQNKIREAYLLAKDLLDGVRMYVEWNKNVYLTEYETPKYETPKIKK